jgi:hypothetical protein
MVKAESEICLTDWRNLLLRLYLNDLERLGRELEDECCGGGAEALNWIWI